MKSRLRQSALVTVLVAGLAILAGWNVCWMMQQRDGAALAADDLATCRELAGDIAALRDQPAAVKNKAAGDQALGRRIDEASQKAGLGGKPINSFSQNPVPLADSPFAQKPTTLSLQGVSVSQLASFLYWLTDQSALSVRDLRLFCPRGTTADDQWDAEVTVTYLMFAPSGKAHNE